MEIRDNNPLETRAREVLKFDFTRANREAIEAHLPEPVTEVPARDEVQLSAAAREALAQEQRVEARTEDRRQQIDSLKTLHAKGDLNTPERIAKAADRMLLGE